LAIRILVADDFAPWPLFISSIIVKDTDWHIVGEAADGFEAVQKAGELKPDLILLDVGLPQLNGIEAARQMIRTFASKSKILFVSGIDDPDIVREALRTGASGYVVKSDAESELTKAIEAVLRGEQFVSSRAKG
jgi:DNA-binding NarL/FixJ family response regulator